MHFANSMFRMFQDACVDVYLLCVIIGVASFGMSLSANSARRFEIVGHALFLW